MATILTNRQLVDTPPVGGLRYGLFDALASRNPMDPRIIAAGLQFLADHCGNDTETYDQTCLASPTKEVVEGSDIVGTLPFWLVNRKRCGTVGRSAEEMAAAVRQALATGAQTRVEDVLWDGDGGNGVLAGVASLTGAGATIVTPGAPGAGAAVAALEAAFYAVNGYVGTIHVNTRAEGALAYADLLRTNVPGSRSGVLTTPLRSVWSIGAGYGITGPAGVAPAAGFVWAFMTSAVHMWESEVMGQRAAGAILDRTANQWDAVAEQVFAVTWDCPEVFAVQIPIAAPAVATAPAVP